MGNRSRYRRVTDLYVRGTEVLLRDDSVLWVQTLNPFEVDEARRDAAAARSRAILTVREIGTSEYESVRANLAMRGRQAVMEDICGLQETQWYIKAVQEIQVDDTWKERVEIMARSEELIAIPPEAEEQELLAKIQGDYIAEIQKRATAEHDYEMMRLAQLSHEELLEKYGEAWMEHRGNAVGIKEYEIAETYFGSRVCDAVVNEDGSYDHEACKQHRELAWESKEEVKDLPEDLYQQIRAGFDAIAMTDRDARFSDRQGSSLESSPLPSKPEDSPPSTPGETSTTAPGI